MWVIVAVRGWVLVGEGGVGVWFEWVGGWVGALAHTLTCSGMDSLWYCFSAPPRLRRPSVKTKLTQTN